MERWYVCGYEHGPDGKVTRGIYYGREDDRDSAVSRKDAIKRALPKTANGKSSITLRIERRTR